MGEGGLQVVGSTRTRLRGGRETGTYPHASVLPVTGQAY